MTEPDADTAIEQLYAAHWRTLVRLATLLLGDPGNAEEVVQDSFVAVHARWHRLEDPDRALAYLRRTVVNRSRSVLRHRTVVDRHQRSLRSPETAPAADHRLVDALRRRSVLDALQRLPRRQREVVVLRYWADLSEAEIAATLGVSRGSVKSHAARAAAALRALLPPSLLEER